MLVKLRDPSRYHETNFLELSVAREERKEKA